MALEMPSAAVPHNPNLLHAQHVLHGEGGGGGYGGGSEQARCVVVRHDPIDLIGPGGAGRGQPRRAQSRKRPTLAWAAESAGHCAMHSLALCAKT